MLWLTLLLNMTPALADEANVKCGGNYAGEELSFHANPVNGVLSATTANETFTAYVDLHRPLTPHLVFGEVVKDEEWDKLKKLRDSSTDQDLQALLSRLGSMNMTELWLGWSEDNYVHLESTQRDRKFSLSCQKL